MKEQSLDELLNELDDQNPMIIQSGTKMLDTYGLFTFDFYCTAILNRSVNLIRGYTLLVRDSNFIAAGALVRLHLDSLLRLYAPSISNMNIDDFAKKVWGGSSIRSIKGKNKQNLTDRFLVEEISKEKGFDWVQHLYDVGNKYVHLTEKHIQNSTKLGSEVGIIEGGIRLTDEFVNIDEKIGGTIWMMKITDGILYLINDWIVLKNSYYNEKN